MDSISYLKIRWPNFELAISIFILFALCSCAEYSQRSPNTTSAQWQPPVREDNLKAVQGLQIAFMPDIHFHDIYAHFEDSAFEGIEADDQGRRATIRSMSAQLRSTRLFNENYFALLAALDELARRKIRWVALPGDFSDDGQVIHLRGLARILDYYHQQYGMEFFATPGNHDPVRPFDTPGGKPDFLGQGGALQAIYSKDSAECRDKKSQYADGQKSKNQLELICSDGIQHLGYESVIGLMSPFGFYPKPDYLYWETPYSSYAYADYNFVQAQREADLDRRQYQICQGAACSRVIDASYLVEPVEGLWLLAIDANVYLPDKGFNENDTQHFKGSGNAGYNQVLKHKPQLSAWIQDVVHRAKQENKTLVAFSHFPMAEFYDGQSAAIAQTFGKEAQQLARKPALASSQWLADTGLQVHIGGHMHMNDTSVIKSPSGNTLFNIQAPSLAAYVPAFKLLTFHGAHKIEVETLSLEAVPRFDELFGLYQMEWQYLAENSPEDIWDEGILNSRSYAEFCNWHLRELARLRFLPGEWPSDLQRQLPSLSGRAIYERLTATKLSHHLNNTGTIAEADYDNWTGFDLIVDFYRVRNAGSLALKDIPAQRLEAYRQLYGALSSDKQIRASASSDGLNIPHNMVHENTDQAFKFKVKQVLGILMGLMAGEVDDHFMIDLSLQRLEPK